MRESYYYLLLFLKLFKLEYEISFFYLQASRPYAATASDELSEHKFAMSNLLFTFEIMQGWICASSENEQLCAWRELFASRGGP